MSSLDTTVDSSVLAPESPADPNEAQSAEDVMLFLLRQAANSADVGDRSRAPVLEVSRVWGQAVLDVTHVERSAEAPRARAALDEASPFAWDGARYICRLQADWAGFVDLGERRFTLAELVAEGLVERAEDGAHLLPVDEQTTVVLDTGTLLYLGRMTRPARTLASRLVANLDYPFLAIVGVAAFLLAMVGALIATTPVANASMSIEVPDRLVELSLKLPDERERPDQRPPSPEEAGQRVKRAEGQAGQPEAPVKRTRGDQAQMNRVQADRAVAEQAGVLAALRDGSTLAATLGDSALSDSLNAGVATLNASTGVGFGHGGLGERGLGLGQGGRAERLGGLGTHGRGGGVEGYGSGGGSLGVRSEGAPPKIAGPPLIVGALDRSLIDEVIKRNMSQIRYCYQRGLTREHSLAGKVTAKFVIGADGQVSRSDIKSSTLGDAEVDACIARRILSFQFPEPRGGGVVIVSYPFLFSPG